MAQWSRNLPASAGDVGSIPGSGRPPGEGNGNPLQYSCLGNPIDRAWWAIVHGVTKRKTRLSEHTRTHNSTKNDFHHKIPLRVLFKNFKSFLKELLYYQVKLFQTQSVKIFLLKYTYNQMNICVFQR